MEHVGRFSSPLCPVCGPLIAEAKTANHGWTRAQQAAKRGTKAHTQAYRNAVDASARLLAAKQEHYSQTQ